MDGWVRHHPRIVVELSGQRPPMALTFTGIVTSSLAGKIVFRDVETDEERSLDFTGAVIRRHSFDPVDSVDSFAVRWEDGLEAVNCLLTELREPGKPN